LNVFVDDKSAEVIGAEVTVECDLQDLLLQQFLVASGNYRVLAFFLSPIFSSCVGIFFISHFFLRHLDGESMRGEQFLFSTLPHNLHESFLVLTFAYCCFSPMKPLPGTHLNIICMSIFFINY